ncbi:hypothetical protein GQ53DRAFT_810856 [Thozetella sp. PMI_491]|nr:hypothetical protein GQ53DRAFT_810856 [Thozetella sp. PMI_491]
MSVADIITLGNLDEKISRWDPSAPNHLYALVDMGSNGIRFSISDLSPPQTRLLRCIYAERAPISLFDALHESSAGGSGPLVFPVKTIALVSETLARFRSIAVDDYGVPVSQVSVFATEAMRRAGNAAHMLEAIKKATPDLSVQILAPEVETLFGALGARSGFVDVKGLLLDLGGGSVQMTYMDTYAFKEKGLGGVGYEIAAAQAGQSLPFGAARLIRVLENAETDVQVAELSKLQSGMRDAFQNLRSTFPSLAATVAALSTQSKEQEGSGVRNAEGLDIYLCGGGFRGYGHMLMHNDDIQPYPVPSVNTYTVSGQQFRKTADMLEMNKNFDGKIFGMSKRRRSQFAAIVTVVEALIAAVPQIRSVTFCGGGNRQGALMMKLDRALREENPLTLILPPPPWVANQEDAATLRSIVSSLRSALPKSVDFSATNTIFTLGLESVFARQIWARTGERPDANASAVLHEAITRDPSCPGLTHLARAVLGLTLCARWDSTLGPVDEPLYQRLRDLANTSDSDTSVWADYIGVTSATLASVVPCWPRTADRIGRTIRFEATAEQGKKKLKIHLRILVSPGAAKGIDLEKLPGFFKGVGKGRKEELKITVTAGLMNDQL